MTRTHICITDKVTNAVLLDGDFFDSIKVDESSWNIEDGTKLILALEKGDENVWKTIMKGDEEIDPKTVDNSKRMEEFDEETQGGLRKVLYEQNRKNMGLPTTEEEKQQEMLKKMWNAEGSPFKGTPFDPTRVTFPSNQSFDGPK